MIANDLRLTLYTARLHDAGIFRGPLYIALVRACEAYYDEHAAAGFDALNGFLTDTPQMQTLDNLKSAIEVTGRVKIP